MSKPLPAKAHVRNTAKGTTLFDQGRILRTALAFAVLGAASACVGLSSKQLEAGDVALKALRKTASATEVGITYQQYGDLLIETKTAVNEALLILPEGELKRSLAAAMDAYADAREAWRIKIDGKQLDASEPPGKALIPKYSLATQHLSSGAMVVGNHADPDKAIQIIWAAAGQELARAMTLLR